MQTRCEGHRGRHDLEAGVGLPPPARCSSGASLPLPSVWHRSGTSRRSAGRGVGPWRHLPTDPQQPRRFSPRTGPGMGIAVGRLVVWGRLSCRAGGWEASQVRAIAWPEAGSPGSPQQGPRSPPSCAWPAEVLGWQVPRRGCQAGARARAQRRRSPGGHLSDVCWSGGRVPSEEELCCRSSHKAAGEGPRGAPHSSGVLLHPGCSGPLPFQPPGAWASGEHVACRVWGAARRCM